MADLNICSVNVRGLNNRIKRRKCFRDLHLNHYDVCLLQETYSCEKMVHLWEAEWGGRAFFSHGESNAHGVGILISRRCSAKIEQLAKDKQGWYIMIKVTVENKDILIVNIYAPNKDEPLFFTQLFDKIVSTNMSSYIMGGDFNLVLDQDRDSKNRIRNNYQAKKIVRIVHGKRKLYRHL